MFNTRDRVNIKKIIPTWPMGSYDSAEIELVECLLLYKLNDIIDPGCHGLYLDDVLIIIDN